MNRVSEIEIYDEKHAAKELILYIENDGDLHRQRVVPIYKNLQKKKERGIYNKELAVKLFMYLVDDEAKKYIKEFGDPGDKVQNIFPKNVRLEVAKDLEDYFDNEYEAGNRWEASVKQAKEISNPVRSYLVTAIEANNIEGGLNGYTVEDFSEKAVAMAAKDWNTFLEHVQEDGIDLYDLKGYSLEDAASDFWMERDELGVGFRDRTNIFLKEEANSLSEIAGNFKKLDLEVGDDGKLHFSMTATSK